MKHSQHTGFKICSDIFLLLEATCKPHTLALVYFPKANITICTHLIPVPLHTHLVCGDGTHCDWSRDHMGCCTYSSAEGATKLLRLPP